MANYSNLKNIIDQVVRSNGQGEITGTNLNQTLQEMVTSLGANYQYAGVATPSTNPGSPDQNVFYIATLAGNYTNFGGLTVPKGISMLRWNGSWSLSTLYTVDTGLTPNSDALVQSGTVFNRFKFDGGAWNVSAHFPAGGPNNDGKYTLEYILNNANTYIPADIRIGGMGVKFVQSSNNKYVHYRLMSDSFNTTVANWQGIDDEPTAGSENLVKSGGIYKELYGVHNNIITELTAGNDKSYYKVLSTPIASGGKFKLIIRNGTAVYNTANRFALINNDPNKRIIPYFNNNNAYEITADTTINSIVFYFNNVTTAGTFVADVIYEDGLKDLIDINTINDENYKKSMAFLKTDFFKSIEEKIKGSSVSTSTGMENVVKQDNHLTLNVNNNNAAYLTTSASLGVGHKYALYYKIQCSKEGAGDFAVQFRSISGSWKKLMYALYGMNGIIQEGTQIFTIESGEGGSFALNFPSQNGLNFSGYIYLYDVTDMSEEQLNSVDFSQAGNGENVLFNKFAKKYFDITELWKNKTVVFYGDSITAGIYPEMVRSVLGFEMVKRAIGGTRFTYVNADSFSSDTRIATIPATADYVCIMGGTNDWGNSTIEQTLEYNNGFDRTLFKGAVAYTITKIQERCPNAQIFILTNIGGRGNEDPTVIQPLPEVSGTTGNTALAIRNATIEVANILNIPVIDTWSCGINGFNRSQYIKDAVHPTYLGHQMIANYIIKKLIEKRSW